MRADYSELGYFWGTNSYPYIDLNYISNDKQYSNEDNDIDAQEINQFIKSTSDAFTKMTEVSPTLNIDVITTKIKVLSQSADYAFDVYDACLVYQQTGSKLEVLIHFYEEAISDIVFYFGLKGTVKGLALGEFLSAAPRAISKKAVIISGIFLAADHTLNPYISKGFIDFIKRNNIFIFNIPYLLQTQSNLEKYKKKMAYEQQVLSDFHGVPNMNGKISIEDIFFNMR